MSSLEELERRINAMEHEMAVLREEAAAARALAAGADRDVADYRAEMRGQTGLINAPREAQLGQDTKLAELHRDVEAGFGEMRAGFQVIVGILERLDGPTPSE